MKVQLTRTEVRSCCTVYASLFFCLVRSQVPIHKNIGCNSTSKFNVFFIFLLESQKNSFEYPSALLRGYCYIAIIYGHTEFQVQCVIIICGALFNLRTDVEMIGSPIAIS